MKLTTERIDRALSQMESMVIPSATPVEQQLCSIFGDHTFFLSNRGVSTLEPIDAEAAEPNQGRVIWLAKWTDETKTMLVPHDPVRSDTIVSLDEAA
ncbi:MAG: hypothetical protein BGP04_04075 [Rhizobiales bacterium 62-17]|nr:hypothetical protein [Hyphomicrobiales bacterium]OJY04695.1 MAG: hypothetical protein BGP04_04075 [Rhizobiales bacterium 62-17]